ncbi:Endocytosis regulator [Diplodia seriata]|uniref:Endocytosis regulator n=1 Tax=Diplodia seriata TaxID=420778 RepID=A0ABR3CEC0_9PEZI
MSTPTSPTSFLCFGLSTGNDLTAEETTEIDRWSFSHPATTALSSGLKAFHFTVVIPGHLPATTSTPIADISYHISATINTSTAISTTSNTASKPLHIRRLLALPIGLTTLDYRRRFPDCNVPTSLSIPAIFRPLDTCTARLTLLNTADRWLRVHKVQWRVEECTQILSPSYSPSSSLHHRHAATASTSSEKHEPNHEQHVRAIASGEHHVTPSEIGALYGSHISELRLDEIAFGITVPEKARMACTLRQKNHADTLGCGDDDAEERPPDYAWSGSCGGGGGGDGGDGGRYQCQHLTERPPPLLQDDDGDGCGVLVQKESRRDSSVDVRAGRAISVSHTLVLEITGKEIRVDGVTGEQLSLGPIIPKVYGARYEIVVSEWSHCADIGGGACGLSRLSGVDFGAVGAASPPSYESVVDAS